MSVIRKFDIEYACVSTVGRLRKNNEDNFYVDAHYRTDLFALDDDRVSGTLCSADNPMVAVFDGMGGEACGEVAAFVAAESCEKFSHERDGYEEYLYELSEMLNERVREECERRSLVLMGTTCAMVQFGTTDIYVLNAGDSRIYKLASHELRRVSEDHCAGGYHGKALTKFLGLPGDEKLRPYIAMGGYKAGDMFLLCSDGVTDMLSDDEIRACIDHRLPVDTLARNLIDQALERGGYDNATALLCRIKRHR